MRQSPISFNKKIIAFIILSIVLIGALVSVIIFSQRPCLNCSSNDNNKTTASTTPSSKWDNISFTLINESVRNIEDFADKILLLEFSSSQCIDCLDQLPILHSFWDIVSEQNDSIILLTLFIDLSTQGDLVDFYIEHNVTWLIGRIDQDTYSSLGYSFIPNFHLFNINSEEISTAQHTLTIEELWDFIDSPLPSFYYSSDYIYYTRKEELSERSSSIVPNLKSFSSSYAVESYGIGDTRPFYCLDTSTSYRSLTAQVVNVSSHAYFFVETALIDIFGLELFQKDISEDLDIFEKSIYPVENSVFGNIEGNLGNIGDGKTIILYSNIPNGWAGYFDPSNEFSQTYLDSIGLSERKSNEWEMIYLDYLEHFETTLAHEFQHLIHFNHDSNEDRWFDEGCAELAGYLTQTMTAEQSNISYFADIHFRNDYDDSLVFWNFYSSGSKDTRIDYGGAYLFLFYLYEQFGPSFIQEMVNSTTSSVTSMNSYLSSLNMTFNDLFFNWQIALFLDNPAIGEGKYYFRNMDYTLSPLDYVSEETIHYLSVPYYGFYSSLVDFTEKELDITIDNANHKKLGVVTLHYNEDTLIDIRTTLTTNTTINVFCPASTTSVLISIAFIDEVYPTKTGDEGLGEKVSVSLRTIDPYKLLLLNPNINLNDTHLIIEGLNILFINETEIYYSNGEDCVSIKLRGAGTTVEWLLFFDENKGFWRGIWSLSSLLPGVYELTLHAQTGDYEIERVFDSLTVPLKINFSLPYISYSNVTNVLTVKVNITIFPIAFIDQIIERAEVKAYLYNDNKEYVFTIILATVDYSQWSAEHYCTKNTLLQGRYYTQIYFIYEGLEDSPHSFPSNRIYLSYHTEESSWSYLFIDKIAVTFFIHNLVVRMKRRKMKKVIGEKNGSYGGKEQY